MNNFVIGRRAAGAASFVAIALILGACSKESSAGTEANKVTATQGATTDAAIAAAPTTAQPGLVAAALSAWESNARAGCKAIDEKFVGVRFIPLTTDTTAEQLSIDQGGFLQADFNGDGKPDYVVTTVNGGCALNGERPDYGRAGPPNDFLISGPAGYKVEVGFGSYLSPRDIGKFEGRDVVNATGSYNGTCDSVAVVTWGWNGNKIDVLERRNSKNAKVDKEGCPISKAAVASGNFPPINKGIYVNGMSCQAAVAASTPGAEGWPADAFAYFDDKTWNFVFEDGMPWGNKDYKGFEPAGPNRYKVKLHTFGNGDGPGVPESSTITVASPTRFTETYHGSTNTYNHCPDSSIPGWLRNHFKA